MNDFVWADKPAGLTTHTSLNEKREWTDTNDGFLEWLSSRIGPLFPIHRLDRETTGVIAFAKTKEAAERARALFESHSVFKEYLFVTDRALVSMKSITVESFIERVGNEYVSQQGREPNARTSFEHVRQEGRFSLWRARPETGKPHQIRLHAADLKMPLLGDVVHGGSEFPTLCLHAHRLTLDSVTRESPPPIYFEDLNQLSDRRLVKWLAACDRRERALRSVPIPTTNSLRWIHSEGDPLRIEELGSVVSLNWFRDTYPSNEEWNSITRLLKLKKWPTWYLQIRADRGKDPITDRSLASEDPTPPERWIANENGLRYEFRRETGLSPGLFLDQRRNREWIAREAKGKRVLNLFCYTGGFSVAAASAPAEHVVSVDVSKPFLEWAKTNFELNGLELTKHEFRAIDSGEYLAWAAKKGLKFDFIVCDPPSFARTNTRGKSSVFRIETEFPDLLEKCIAVAAPGAKILFSTNYEQWTPDDFAKRTLDILKSRGKLAPAPTPDLDFELPRQARHMKSLIIKM